jgi:hypothetical protein
VNFFSRGGVAHLLAARLARVLVAIACIFQLGAALEVLENQLVGSATHDGPKSRTVDCVVGDERLLPEVFGGQ